MGRITKLLALVLAVAFVQGCSPANDVGSQTGDLGKNIVISPDSTEEIDVELAKKLVLQVVDTQEWASVGFAYYGRGEAVLSMHNKDTYGIDFATIRFADGKVYDVDYNEFPRASVASKDFYPSCPDSTIETFWTTECTTIQTATSVISTNNSAAQQRGYKTKQGTGSGESLSNVQNHLSCSTLKLWGRVGHGYESGLQLYNHQNLTGFSGISLSGKGIYANSCKAYNQPFQGKVTGAGAKMYISGISNLSIGPSENVFKCWWGKVKDQAQICSTLNSCDNTSDTYGCHQSGNNQIDAPGSNPGPNPTPTPGPNPTPTPGPTPGDSCQGKCGQKSGSCWCDTACKQYGDCCADYDQFCGSPNPTPTPGPNPTPTPGPNPTPTPGDSCQGKCGQKSGSCWCDNYCKQYGDCCADYDQFC